MDRDGIKLLIWIVLAVAVTYELVFLAKGAHSKRPKLRFWVESALVVALAIAWVNTDE